MSFWMSFFLFCYIKHLILLVHRVKFELWGIFYRRLVLVNQCTAIVWTTMSLSADDFEVKYSCNAIVWCSHFHVWCKLFVRERIPKQSLLHLFGITLTIHKNEENSVVVLSMLFLWMFLLNWCTNVCFFSVFKYLSWFWNLLG